MNAKPARIAAIVNVVAALFALGSLVFAGKPADSDHPYGHGKIEYFSAVFEGGLIAFAAVGIIWYAVAELIRGPEIAKIEMGLLLTAGAGLINAALGWFLVKTGRRVQSLILVADGQHVLSDFWTSLGVVIGLGLVKLTGIAWLDPAVALLLGVNLAGDGSAFGCVAPPEVSSTKKTPASSRALVGAFNEKRDPGIIRMHRLRAIRAGPFTHIDAHLVVPEFWPVHRAHDASDAFEAQVIASCGIQGEIVFHTDPCRRVYCDQCDIGECAIRIAPFRSRSPLTIDEIVRPDMPPARDAP